VTALATQDAAQRRLANFFRGTMRDPSWHADGSLIQHSNETGAFSNEQIAQAVVAIMRGPSGDGPFDPIMASGIAGQLALTVNTHLRGVDPAQLAANGTFKQLVSQRLDGNDANRSIESAAQMLRHANVTSADSAAAQALLGDRATIVAVRFREGIDRAERSSARYDVMADTVAKRMDDARTLAVTLGMGWAVNSPELLRLGPGAIQTLHDAGVHRERFERMTGERVGFRAATAVDIAAFARRHNLTPEQTNRLYDRISDGVEIISGGDRRIQRELDDATRRYVNGTDTPEARRALEEAYRRHADTPEKKKAAESTPQAIIAPTQRDIAAVAARNADVAARNDSGVRADATETRVAAKEDDLDARVGVAGEAPKPAKKTAEVQAKPAAPKV